MQRDLYVVSGLPREPFDLIPMFFRIIAVYKHCNLDRLEGASLAV
ncbi:hypothetical protein FHR70_001650 [Microvirga lupini]|uniref:Uncharacterized protein n=1 Tax=Microvirga lupini TaxID=420324 RepID=A0A7W4VK49_9HYPH|nr:hypothetical protein [Microvirga lupini]MBB3018596.1 hypothetical protein [Microvirga lupini]